MAEAAHDLVVIGGGPGGYVAAIRAAQLGLDAACIECEEALGGTCLRVGCIPSKALLESSERYWSAREELGVHGVRVDQVALDLAAMLNRKSQIVRSLAEGVAGLLAKHKITRYRGRGRFDGPGRIVVSEGENETHLRAKHILIATGSRVAQLDAAPFDGRRIVSSTEALAFDSVPEHLIIIGAGYIGLELGSVWRRLGARVTVLEYLDRILPGMDAQLAALAQRMFETQGLEFRLGSRVELARVEGEACFVRVAGGEPLSADRVLVAVGRVPNTAGLGLETVGVETDAKGRIRVDERFATTAEGIYAIGDVIGGAMLAHKAEEEGIAFVERLVTGYGHVNYDAIPAVVYTMPEIASVGKTEEELRTGGIEYRRGVFAFRANARVRCLGHTEGIVKMLADARTDRLLGVHIIGPRAGDLIAEAAMALACGASSEDVARTSHAHPTLAEALKEAALAVAGQTINA